MSLTLLKKSLEILECNPAKETNKDKTKQKSKRKFEHTIRDRQVVKLKDIKKEMTQGDKKSKENLKKLLALSKNTLKESDAEKFVKRAHRGRYEEIAIPKREIESIFTEEDFRSFEEEYFKS